MMEKNYHAELESCFTNYIIQWIRALDKSKVGEPPPLLGLLEVSMSRFANSSNAVGAAGIPLKSLFQPS